MIAARRTLIGLLASAALLAGCDHTLIRLRHEGRRSRTAVLIVPGAFYDAGGRRAMEDWLSGRDFDVYVPDFESRDGLEACVANLASFIDEHDLAGY
ncbi:MAG: hypothetical protein JRI55_18550 [Deltaproteobacteria bacterium]|jgi:hypothetical protein|nr:hypothetical protein [Deltaproteobacteria bacterium]